MSKIIVLTGASSGIGKATAKMLIKQGHTVYCLARRLNKMKDLMAMGGRPFVMDISKDGDIYDVLNHIKSKHDHIDILINCAGYGDFAPFETQSLKNARHQFDVNLFGLAQLTQVLLPLLEKSEKAKIINISSIVGEVYMPFASWYVASKHALEGWTDCIRVEMAAKNIQVQLVQPGIIKSEFDQAFEDKKARGNVALAFERFKTALATSYAKGSSPELVAKKIVACANHQTNKRRVKVGYGSSSTTLLRIFTPKSMWDWVYGKYLFKNITAQTE